MIHYLSDSVELQYRPIERGDLEQIDLDCWPTSRRRREALFARQGTIGMAALEDERCVGMLHCYGLTLPEVDRSGFPEWTETDFVRWPLGWAIMKAAEMVELHEKRIWGHGCFHVGRGKKSNGEAESWDPNYCARGIGTSLARESIRWAREQGYEAIIAMGAPRDSFEYAVWLGVLPATSYERLGFEELGREENGKRLPWWVEEAPPAVQAEVEHALEAGASAYDLCGRLMVLKL